MSLLECVFDITTVSGVFTLWSEWTSCSVTCRSVNTGTASTGITTRSRTCTTITPAVGECVGETTQTQTCTATTSAGIITDVLQLPYCPGKSTKLSLTSVT